MLIAKETLKNAFDQVLFVKGREYNVLDRDSKRIWVLNELHSESPFRRQQIANYFTNKSGV